MHIGPIPQQPTSVYTVYVLTKACPSLPEDNAYEKVGLDWPNLRQAEVFQESYEKGNPHIAGRTIIVEKTTTWTILSDYALGRSTLYKKRKDDAHDARQGRKVPSQRGLQWRGQDRDAIGDRER